MRFTSPIVLLLLLLIAVPATADDARPCSSIAHVSWETSWEQVTVDGLRVDAPDCGDGELVGVQLITEDGDVPDDGPLMAALENGGAIFDLGHLAQQIEPVTGVRVFLEQAVEELTFFEVTVDRRFFNAPGNEQVGLRQVTELTVEEGEEFIVPGAPARYDEVPCADVDRPPGDDVIGEGSGAFLAKGSGRHVVCYRQAPSGGPPQSETEVLGSILEMGEPAATTSTDGRAGAANQGTEVLGVSESEPSGLARTGAHLLLALGLGSLLLAVGWQLTRRERTC